MTYRVQLPPVADSKDPAALSTQEELGPVGPIATPSPAVLQRVAIFRQQLEGLNWPRKPIPLLVLPDAPASGPGACVSCGETNQQGHWRCGVCQEAVRIVTEALVAPTVVCGECGRSLLRTGATVGERGLLRCPGCCFRREEERLRVLRSRPTPEGGAAFAELKRCPFPQRR